MQAAIKQSIKLRTVHEYSATATQPPKQPTLIPYKYDNL